MRLYAVMATLFLILQHSHTVRAPKDNVCITLEECVFWKNNTKDPLSLNE